MSKVRLVYRETQKSHGVPQLEDPAGKLSHEELRPWEAELERRYAQLAQSDGETIVFTSGLSNLPRRYRVHVRAVKNGRCPVVELLDVEEEAGPAAGEPAEWLPGFVEGAGRLLRDSIGNGAERAALRFVLEELAENNGPELTALLLGGYLYMAEAQCAGQANATDRVALYRLAARVVETWCAGCEANGGAARRLGKPTGARPAHRWMPRVLARVLGIAQSDPE